MFSNIKIFFKNIINDNSLDKIQDEYSDPYEKSFRSRIEFDETRDSLLNLLQKDLINIDNAEESNIEYSINYDNSEQSDNYDNSEQLDNLEYSYNSDNLEYSYNSDNLDNQVINFNMISYVNSEKSNSNKSDYDSNSSENSIKSEHINNFIENESHLYDNNEIDYSNNKSHNIFKKLYKKIKSKIRNKKSKKTGNNDNEIKPSYDISELVIYNQNFN